MELPILNPSWNSNLAPKKWCVRLYPPGGCGKSTRRPVRPTRAPAFGAQPTAGHPAASAPGACGADLSSSLLGVQKGHPKGHPKVWIGALVWLGGIQPLVLEGE